MPTWNAITVVRACRAGLAGLALVILSASLAAAEFGPRTTLGNNYQQWSDVESVNAIDPGNCTTANCYLIFQPIPQKKPLIVQHVACRALISNGGLLSVHLRTRKKQTFPFTWTPLVPVSTTGTTWVVNSPAMHLLRSGERPFLWFSNSVNTGWVIDCSISGTLQ